MIEEEPEEKSSSVASVLDKLVELLRHGGGSAMLYGFVIGASVISLVHIASNVTDPFILYSASGICEVATAWSLFEIFRIARGLAREEALRVHRQADRETSSITDQSGPKLH